MTTEDGPGDREWELAGIDEENETRARLAVLRQAAEAEELRAATSRALYMAALYSGEQADLLQVLARLLTEAGLPVHRCNAPEGSVDRRGGGVCLTPLAPSSSTGGRDGAVGVSWTCHDLLHLDTARYGVYRGVQSAMNEALWAVLEQLQFVVEPFGVGGVPMVTGWSGDRPEG